MIKHATYAPRICAIIYLCMSRIIRDKHQRRHMRMRMGREINTDLTAFNGGNPLKSVITIVIAGCRCPPLVALQMTSARTIPIAYAKPTVNRAISCEARQSVQYTGIEEGWRGRTAELFTDETSEDPGCCGSDTWVRRNESAFTLAC